MRLFITIQCRKLENHMRTIAEDRPQQHMYNRLACPEDCSISLARHVGTEMDFPTRIACWPTAAVADVTSAALPAASIVDMGQRDRRGETPAPGYAVHSLRGA